MDPNSNLRQIQPGMAMPAQLGEQMIAGMMEHSPLGLALLRLDGRIVEANGTLCRLLELPLHSLLEADIQSLTHPNDLLPYLNQASRLIEGAIPSYTLETRMLQSNGQPVWCRLTCTLLRENGKPAYMLHQFEDLTETKRLEQSILDSGRTMKTLFDSIVQPFALLDKHARFTYANRKAVELFGLYREELTGLCLWDLYIMGADRTLYVQYKQAAEQMEAADFLCRPFKSGAWFHISLCPNRDGMAMFMYDMSESMGKINHLQTMLQQLESLMENSGDAITIYDTKGRCLRCNPAWNALYGYTYEDQLRSPWAFIPEDRKLEAEHLFRLALGGKQISGFETTRLTRDGALLNVSLTVTPVTDPAGAVVAVASSGRDISDRKQMERALYRSEEQYRIITENTTDLVGLYTPGGVVLFASPSYDTLLGRKPEQIIGKNVREFADPAVAQQLLDWFRTMMKSKQASRIELTAPVVDGRVLQFESYGKPVVAPDGYSDIIVLISRDITERKKTELLLRQSDKLSVAGQLAAGIAHEIRNPLTALKGFTQFMRQNDQTGCTYYDIMMAEFTRIEHIISELLLLSKPQAVQYERLHIHDIVSSVTVLLGSHASMRNVELTIDCEPGLPELIGEPNQLKQVLINVVKNAIEAMPSGGLIAVSASRKTDRLQLSIVDEGIGIPQEHIARLGEPFYTTKEGGSGLGLMISQKIIAEHGGTMSISSRLNEGTRVDISLPLA